MNYGRVCVTYILPYEPKYHEPTVLSMFLKRLGFIGRNRLYPTRGFVKTNNLQ